MKIAEMLSHLGMKSQFLSIIPVMSFGQHMIYAEIPKTIPELTIVPTFKNH